MEILPLQDSSNCKNFHDVGVCSSRVLLVTDKVAPSGFSCYGSRNNSNHGSLAWVRAFCVADRAGCWRC